MTQATSHPHAPGTRSRCRPGSRRAVALLVTLVTLAALSLVITKAARTTVHAARTHAIILHEAMADDLLIALDAPIRLWLSEHAVSVVLPPEADEPSVTLLDDRLLLDTIPARVRVLATDPSGLGTTSEPARAGPASPVRLNISTAPIAHLRSLDLPNTSGELETITASRRNGRRPNVPATWLRLPTTSAQTPPLRAVNTASRWEISIDISVGLVTKRWAAAYAPDADRWQCLWREIRHD